MTDTFQEKKIKIKKQKDYQSEDLQKIFFATNVVFQNFTTNDLRVTFFEIFFCFFKWKKKMVMRDDENHFFTINRLHEIRKNLFFVFFKQT